MKPKKFVSSAVIAATAVSVAPGQASASIERDAKGPTVSEYGVTLDALRLDEDVLQLGGMSQETGFFGADEEAFKLAEAHFTWTGHAGGGSSGGGSTSLDRTRTGRETLTVTNRVTKSSMFVVFDWITGLFFDPDTNEQIDPPDWVREEVEKLAE